MINVKVKFCEPAVTETVCWPFGPLIVAPLFTDHTHVSPAAGETWVWSVNNGATINGPNGQQTVSVTAGSQNFTLTLIILSQSGTLVCNNSVTVSPSPVVSCSANPSTINLSSANHSSQLDVSLAGSADTDSTHYTYSWTLGAGAAGSFNFNNIKNPIYTAGTADAGGTVNFTVTVTNKTTGCSVTSYCSVNVSAGAGNCPTIPNLTVCMGSTKSFTADRAPSSGETWVWAANNGATINGQNGQQTVSVTAGSQNFNLTLIILSQSGTLVCNNSVTVSPSPVVSCSANPSTITLSSANHSTQLDVSLSGSADTDSSHYTYSWTLGSGAAGTLNFNNIKNPIYTAGASDAGGTVNFTVTVTNKTTGCSATSNCSVNVSAGAGNCPTIPNLTVCIGSTKSFTADRAPSSGETWVWAANNGATINGQNGQQTVSVTAGSQNFNLTLIILSQSGTLVCNNSVTVSPSPVVSCSANPSTITLSSANHSTQLDVSLAGSADTDSTHYTYSWTLG